MDYTSLANPKKTLCIGNWKITTMYSVGKTAEVVKEMRRYNLDMLGISNDGLRIRSYLLYSRKKDVMMMTYTNQIWLSSPVKTLQQQAFGIHHTICPLKMKLEG